jgi:hypothetical protein
MAQNITLGLIKSWADRNPELAEQYRSGRPTAAAPRPIVAQLAKVPTGRYAIDPTEPGQIVFYHVSVSRFGEYGRGRCISASTSRHYYVTTRDAYAVLRGEKY